MKVDLFVSKDIKESYAEIHSDKLTTNIQKAMDILEEEENNSVLAVKEGKNIHVLEMENIFMLRVESKKLKIYTENKHYQVNKPLYEFEELLSSSFVRISKSTIVNLKKIDKVSPSLKGMMFINLTNGLNDNISRKYLSEFKIALGL